ncbi:hypothetical protein HK101_004497, partial [Irineochytrium annulatum]
MQGPVLARGTLSCKYSKFSGFSDRFMLLAAPRNVADVDAVFGELFGFPVWAIYGDGCAPQSAGSQGDLVKALGHLTKASCEGSPLLIVLRSSASAEFFHMTDLLAITDEANLKPCHFHLHMPKHTVKMVAKTSADYMDWMQALLGCLKDGADARARGAARAELSRETYSATGLRSRENSLSTLTVLRDDAKSPRMTSPDVEDFPDTVSPTSISPTTSYHDAAISTDQPEPAPASISPAAERSSPVTAESVWTPSTPHQNSYHTPQTYSHDYYAAALASATASLPPDLRPPAIESIVRDPYPSESSSAASVHREDDLSPAPSTSSRSSAQAAGAAADGGAGGGVTPFFLGARSASWWSWRRGSAQSTSNRESLTAGKGQLSIISSEDEGSTLTGVEGSRREEGVMDATEIGGAMEEEEGADSDVGK